MTKYHEAGKGGDMRPTDHKKYGSNYDVIWGNKKKDDNRAEDEEFERIKREQERKNEVR